MDNPNLQGTLGLYAVVRSVLLHGLEALLRIGISTNVEASNSSKVDLVIRDGSRLYTVQVKSTKSKNGSAVLDLRKRHLDSKYDYTYTSDDVDLFALYVVDQDLVVYISSKEACDRNQVAFRLLDTTANNQFGVREAFEYTDLHKILRDCTSHTRYNSGDDTVQTTTSIEGLGD